MPKWWQRWAERIAPVLAEAWLRSRSAATDGAPEISDTEPDPARSPPPVEVPGERTPRDRN